MAFKATYSPREKCVKQLFGNIHRLDVFAVVAEYSIDPPETFQTYEVQEQVREHGVNPTAAHQQLQILEELGMVQRLETEGHLTCYERTDSPLWSIVAAAVVAVNLQFPREST